MTALKKFQKLESPGLWRETPDGQRREVALAFGEASLVLSDPRTGTALSHWSLPAIRRTNPGALPAVYAPDTETDAETLEVEDATMIGAIETVRGAVARAQARPGRLRALLAGGAALAAVSLAVFWLPQALIAQTAALVPGSKRAEIGRMALADVTRVAGMPCASPLGLRAADRLSQRVLGPEGHILFLRDGPRPAAHLPGTLVLLSKSLVENEDGPQVAAGYALAEKLRGERADPLVPILRHAGLLATVRLLTTGTLPPAALAGYAETMLNRPPPAALPDDDLLALFRAAALPSSPYAYALDRSGETVLGLIEADPFRTEASPPVLPDEDWISLQAICQAG